MFETTMLKGLTDMMTEIPVWFVGIDVADYVNNGGYCEIISTHATEKDAKKALNNLIIDDDRTTVHKSTLLKVVCEMARNEYFSGAKWQREHDAKVIQHYEKMAERADERVKAELLETITKILK